MSIAYAGDNELRSYAATTEAFDPGNLNELYQQPDLYDALCPVGPQLPFYLDLARQHPHEILELACGTGQLVVPIAAAGLAACGLDQSAAMLGAARERAAAAGVTPVFAEGDMRGFELGRQFNLIFLARNSLLHLSSVQDIVATFAAVRRHLAPGGVFAFDVSNPDVKALARPSGQRYPGGSVDTAVFGRLVVEGTHNYDAAEQLDRTTCYISAPDQPDKWVLTLAVRNIFPQELRLLVEAGGLRLLQRFGTLSRKPFASDSPLQVCLCAATS
jgi:SAM-dependent methyltransferase